MDTTIYWTIDETRKQLGISYFAFQTLVNKGVFPAPTHVTIGRDGKPKINRRYSTEDVGTLREILTRPVPLPARAPGWYTRADVAKRVGVPNTTVGGWIRAGRIPAPTHQTKPRTRQYSQSEFDQIIGLVTSRNFSTSTSAEARRRAAGYLSQRDLAEMLKVPLPTINSWVRKKVFPTRTHRVGVTWYYHEDDLPALRKLAADRKASHAGKSFCKLAAELGTSKHTLRRLIHAHLPGIGSRPFRNRWSFTGEEVRQIRKVFRQKGPARR